MTVFRVARRLAGFLLLAGSLYPFLQALHWLDRREYVASTIATLVGVFLGRAGVDLLEPDSAE